MKTVKTYVWACDLEHPTAESYEGGLVESVATSIFISSQVMCNNHNLENPQVDLFVTFEAWLTNFDNENNHIIYFHNLDYDGRALMHWFLDYHLQPECLMSNGKIYQITWKNLDIRCSCKLLANPSIDKLGKGFGFKKLEYDYQKIRHYKNVDDIPTDLQEYAKRDVEILGMALQKYLPILTKKGKGRLTIGSTAKNSLINSIGYDFFITELKGCNPWPKYNEDDFDSKEQWYNEYVMPYRASYFGGLSVINKKYLGVEIKANIKYYDINSSYPSVMFNDLPYGKGSNIPLKNSLKWCYIKLKSAKPKFWNSIPCIPLSKCWNMDSIYIDKEWTGYRDIYVWQEELDCWNQYWDLEYEVCEERSLYFQKRPYCRQWVKSKYLEKSNADDASKKMIAKILLNSAYGKWAENPKSSKSTYDKKEGLFYITKSEVEYELDDKSYLPLSAYVTAKARVKLIHTAMSCDWIYCDTDSVYSLTPIDHKYIDNKELGKWKDECEVENMQIHAFKCFKPKCYGFKYTDLDTLKEKYKYNVSGLPKDIANSLKWEDFKIGFCTDTKLSRYLKYGWVCLKTTDFTIW